MMVDLGEAEVLEWQMAQPDNCLVWRNFSGANLCQQAAQFLGIHGSWSA
jgi:hypothetical protein